MTGVETPSGAKDFDDASRKTTQNGITPPADARSGSGDDAVIAPGPYADVGAFMA